MLDNKIRRKLESLRELPTVPIVLSEVLNAVDNLDLSARSLGRIIEKDQSLTAKVLQVANSPFYGFARRISTIDLAIVVLGLNTIKEIVLSLALKRFFTNVRRDLFDVNEFWNYSVYCGAASKYLARKLNYRITGEAFVAGLMHDIGILIIIQYFTADFKEIRLKQKQKGFTMIEAENNVLNTNHAQVGSWLAVRWQLPRQLCEAIECHHDKYVNNNVIEKPETASFGGFKKPLTAIVATAEWFAGDAGLKKWTHETKSSTLYFDSDMLDVFSGSTVLNKEGALEQMRLEIFEDYEKALETHSI